MLEGWFEGRTVWLYREAVDFRKQLNGLSELTESKLEKNPMDGSIYVFRNRGKDKIKLLVWERNGYFLGYKRLEKGRFDFPTNATGQITISIGELSMLLSGMPMVRMGSGNLHRELSHI